MERTALRPASVGTEPTVTTSLDSARVAPDSWDNTANKVHYTACLAFTKTMPSFCFSIETSRSFCYTWTFWNTQYQVNMRIFGMLEEVGGARGKKNNLCRRSEKDRKASFRFKIEEFPAVRQQC